MPIQAGVSVPAVAITAEEIADGFKTYPGLAHRMEELGRIGRVVFINDSKATNADSTEKALTSFHGIFWILGNTGAGSITDEIVWKWI